MFEFNHPCVSVLTHCSVKLTTVLNDDLVEWHVVLVDSDSLHGSEGLSTINHTAEDDMGAIEMWGGIEADEELGAIGSWSSVGHGKDTSALMLDEEVLIIKLTLVVDRVSTSSVVLGEVSTLGHESWDDSVEGAALVAEAMLTGAESSEVLGGLWGLVGELHGEAAGALATDGDVHVHLLCHLASNLLLYL